MKKFLPAMLCVLITGACIAQPLPNLMKRYNGSASKDDGARAMVTDNFGNIYVTGHSETRNNNYDYVTIKYNATGGEEWVRGYNGPANSTDRATAIAVDNDGNVFVTGRSVGLNTNEDYATIKYAPDGELKWVKRFNSASNLFDIAYDIKVDPSGNIYVTGFSDGASQFNGNKITTIKYSNLGEMVWDRHYDEVPNIYDGSAARKEEGKSIAIDAAGNCYITGIGGNAIINNRTFLLKYSPTGQVLWTQNGAGNNGRKILVSSDGSVVVASWGGYTAKFNGGTGEVIWETFASLGSTCALQDAVEDGNGNIFVTGYVRGISEDYFTAKLNAQGSELWTRTYNGSKNGIDMARSISLDKFDNVFVTGRALMNNGSRNGILNIATIKYSNGGNLEWVAFYDSPEKQGSEAFVTCVDINNNVLVAGSTASKSNFDALTIRYPGQALARAFTDNQAINNSSSLQLTNFPNPFTDQTTIEFHLPAANTVEVNVYDMKGNIVSSILNSYGSPGKKYLAYSALRLSAGIYIAELRYDKVVERRKFMIVK